MKIQQIIFLSCKLDKSTDCHLLNGHEVLIDRDLLEVTACDISDIRDRRDSFNPRPKLQKLHHCTPVPCNILSLHTCSLQYLQIFLQATCVSEPPMHCLFFADITGVLLF